LIGDQGRLQDSEGVVRSRERLRQDGFFGMSPTVPRTPASVPSCSSGSSRRGPRSSWRWAVLHNPLAEFPLPQGVLPVREFTVTERDGDRLTMAWLDSDMDA